MLKDSRYNEKPAATKNSNTKPASSAVMVDGNAVRLKMCTTSAFQSKDSESFMTHRVESIQFLESRQRNSVTTQSLRGSEILLYNMFIPAPDSSNELCMLNALSDQHL